MMIKNLSITIIILLLANNVWSQRNISGYVLNEMGDPIPYAHIQDLNNINLNTTSNEEGHFELSLEDNTYIFKISARSYKTEEIETTITSETDVIEFVIINNHNTYKEVVITSDGEDPGVKRMRQVIAKRQQHASYLNSLTSNVYLKGNLKIIDFPEYIMGQKVTDTMLAEMGLDSNKQGIVYLLEQHTKYHFQAPDKTYNEILSVRTSGDPQGLGFSQMPPIINIYDNNIHILEGLSPRGIVSPAHSNALHFYDYKLIDIFEDNGKSISKILVTPKRKYEPLFTGYVYVVENDWIFHSVELSVDRSTGIDLLDSIQLIQTYSNYKDDQWIIQNQLIVPSLSMFGIQIRGSFLTHYSHIAINEAIDKSIINSKVISKYDSTALDKDSTYWTENRKIPLTELEEKNFVKGDSLFSLRLKSDSIFHSKTHYNTDFLSILATGPSVTKHPTKVGLNGLLDIVQFNNVEGLNLTLKPYVTTQWKDGLSAKFSSQLRYGFASEKFYSTIKAELNKRDNKHTSKYKKLTFEGGQYIYDITGLQPITELYNTYTALSGKNYLSFYDKKFISTRWLHSLGQGLTYSIEMNYEDRGALNNNSDYTWFSRTKEHIRPNQPAGLPMFTPHKAFIVSAQLEYQPGWKYIQYPKHIEAIKSKAPIFRLNYTKGINEVLGSEVDFDKLVMGMRYNQQMRLLGELRMNLEAGTFLNKASVGLPDYFHNRGNQILLANDYLNSFQVADYYSLSHQRDYGKLHLEWHMNGFISNKIPGLNKLNWNFVVSNNTLFFNSKDYYTEVAFGIENIGYNLYRLGRVDYYFGYNSMTNSRETGLRIGLSGIFTNMVSIE